MTEGVAGATYSLQGLQDMLGVSRNDVLAFIKAGFVSPTRGARNAYRFGFQDVVLLRTAQTLREAHISAARIRKSLQRLKALLPAEMPLTGLRITALGDDIAVREQGQAVAAETGQLLFDFEVAVERGSVLVFPAVVDRNATGPLDQEKVTPASEDFIARGARFFDAGSFDEALVAYDEGLEANPHDAGLMFNRAVTLEELGRIDDALSAYHACLVCDVDYVDAHWNLARLYEQRGVKTLALRHFSAYRRLSR